MMSLCHEFFLITLSYKIYRRAYNGFCDFFFLKYEIFKLFIQTEELLQQNKTKKNRKVCFLCLSCYIVGEADENQLLMLTFI